MNDKEWLELLIKEINIIENFIINEDDENLTSKWDTLCQSGFFQVHNGWIMTERKAGDFMFVVYRKWNYGLNLSEKIRFLDFYQRFTGRAWKEITTQPADILNKGILGNETCIEEYGTRRFWDEMMADINKYSI